MKMKEARDIVMKLINMYSERGAVISSNDKNIADFDIKARDYLNIAMKTVTTRFPLVKTYTIIKTASSIATPPVTMPSGFLRLMRVYKEINGNATEYDNYYYVDNNHIALPANESGTFMFKYGATATEIPSNPSSIYELDIPTALESAVCYYAAAMMIQPERPEQATRLLEFYTELMHVYNGGRHIQKRIKRV